MENITPGHGNGKQSFTITRVPVVVGAGVGVTVTVVVLRISDFNRKIGRSIAFLCYSIYLGYEHTNTKWSN
jgi:hypothetical protein